jgi:hypothetical protein
MSHEQRANMSGSDESSEDIFLGSDRETGSPPDNCPICQDEMPNPAAIKTLPCQHQFHTDCIQRWIEMRNLCPLCKRVADVSQPVRELEDDRHDLTRQMFDNLIHGSANPMGVNFWMQLFENSGWDDIPYMPSGITIHSYMMEDDRPQHSLRNQMWESLQTSISRMIIPPDLNANIHHMLEEFQRPNRQHPRTVAHPYHPQTHTCSEQAQCSNCFLMGCRHTVRRCSGCHQIRYCSRECQEEHWEQHKAWCLSHRV